MRNSGLRIILILLLTIGNWQLASGQDLSRLRLDSLKVDEKLFIKSTDITSLFDSLDTNNLVQWKGLSPELQDTILNSGSGSSISDSILNGIIDVTNPPYNADNTGATDATAAILQAIDSVNTTRRTIYFPDGKYRLTTFDSSYFGGSYTVNAKDRVSHIFINNLHDVIFRGSGKAILFSPSAASDVDHGTYSWNYGERSIFYIWNSSGLTFENLKFNSSDVYTTAVTDTGYVANEFVMNYIAYSDDIKIKDCSFYQIYRGFNFIGNCNRININDIKAEKMVSSSIQFDPVNSGVSTDIIQDITVSGYSGLKNGRTFHVTGCGLYFGIRTKNVTVTNSKEIEKMGRDVFLHFWGSLGQNSVTNCQMTGRAGFSELQATEVNFTNCSALVDSSGPNACFLFNGNTYNDAHKKIQINGGFYEAQGAGKGSRRFLAFNSTEPDSLRSQIIINGVSVTNMTSQFFIQVDSIGCKTVNSFFVTDDSTDIVQICPGWDFTNNSIYGTYIDAVWTGSANLNYVAKIKDNKFYGNPSGLEYAIKSERIALHIENNQFIGGYDSLLNFGKVSQSRRFIYCDIGFTENPRIQSISSGHRLYSKVGDKIINSNPNSGETEYWVCTTEGYSHLAETLSVWSEAGIIGERLFPNMMSNPFYRFDGVNDEIIISNDANMDWGNESGTVETIVKIMELDTDNLIFTRYQDSNNQFQLILSNNNYLSGRLEDNGAELHWGSMEWKPDIGKWYHVVYIFENGLSNKIYINGTHQVLDIKNTFAGGGFNISADAKIGAVSTTSKSNISVARIRFYNLALSNEEVREFINGSIPFKYNNAAQDIVASYDTSATQDISITGLTFGWHYTWTKGNADSLMIGSIKAIADTSFIYNGETLRANGGGAGDLSGSNLRHTGCIIELDGSTATQNIWFDKQNGLNGTVSGASLNNTGIPQLQIIGEHVAFIVGVDTFYTSAANDSTGF